MNSVERKAIRAEAATMTMAEIRAQADRLTKEAADLQGLADAWRKAHVMEKHRREKRNGVSGKQDLAGVIMALSDR